jgi:hypothetical protein
MDKKDVQLQNQLEHISICDIMKDNTSKVIQKMEAGIPPVFQNYSDLYTAYLHMFNDLFGTCYMAEKEFFDKLNIDQGILREIKKNTDSMTDNYLKSIDASQILFAEYVKLRLPIIKSFDDYTHVMMDFYAKALSEFNKSVKPSESS